MGLLFKSGIAGFAVKGMKPGGILQSALSERKKATPAAAPVEEGRRGGGLVDRARRSSALRLRQGQSVAVRNLLGGP